MIAQHERKPFMLNWLKNKLGVVQGASGPVRNGLGLSREAIALLVDDLKLVEELIPGTTGRLLDYILNGKDAGVLSALESNTNVPHRLLATGHWTSGNARESARRKFWRLPEADDPVLCGRLARVYSAAVKAAARGRLLAMGTVTHYDAILKGGACIETLVGEATAWGQAEAGEVQLSVRTVQSILDPYDVPPDFMVRAAFFPELQGQKALDHGTMFALLKGFGALALQYSDLVTEALRQEDAGKRIHALGALRKGEVPLRPFTPEIIAAALELAKTVRAAAVPVLAFEPELFGPLLREKITSGSGAERPYAVAQLADLEGKRCHDFLRERLAQEKLKGTIKAIKAVVGSVPVPGPDIEASSCTLPPLPPVDLNAPLAPEVLGEMKTLFHECNEREKSWHTGILKQQIKCDAPVVVVDKEIEAAFVLMQGTTAICSNGSILPNKPIRRVSSIAYESVARFLLGPRLQLVHSIRFLIAQRQLHPTDRPGPLAMEYVRQALCSLANGKHFTLREISHAMKTLGCDPKLLAREVLRNPHLFAEGDIEALWELFFENPGFIEMAFDQSERGTWLDSYYQRQERETAYSLMQRFPALPPSLAARLWELALTGPKSERPSAQECLAKAPDRDPRLIAALSETKQDIRAEAAAWIGRLNLREAIPALEAALKKEKSDVATGAILLALEAMGVAMDSVLRPSDMLTEAQRGLAKSIPKELAWLPLDFLPGVTWQTSGRHVDKDILKWLLAKTCRLKNPQPDPLLRRQCAMFAQKDREALGDFLLTAWMGEDTRCLKTPAELDALAKQSAPQMRQWYPKATPEELYRIAYANFEHNYRNSAVASKGVLAVVAACGSPNAAVLAERYLKRWYGMRAAQCKALVRMLAWVDQPGATQYLLSVANRFRTRGIQEEAQACVKAIAEFKNWTMDELADRTIPAAGMDEDGVLELDYGARRFTATLGPDMKFALAAQDGRALKALPDPRQEDDEEKAKEAKRLFAATRKALVGVTKMQTARLYEAMCTQRGWTRDDWRAFILRHPIMKHLCTQLVWCACEGERLITSFRPLEDGSLSDVQDNEVEITAGQTVRLAHSMIVDAQTDSAWQRHIVDYEVTPLFTQFGRKTFRLEDGRHREREITQFKGYIIDSFKLRGVATKLGYTRGQPGDGGWFCTYHRSFSSLGLEAVIEFTGNGLPEENRPSALINLQFHTAEHAPIPLQRVPPVLLSECWNDLRQMAEAGAGFDPAWEAKVRM
jgi:hypothetical protein